jgi:hypothetical protein
LRFTAGIFEEKSPPSKNEGGASAKRKTRKKIYTEFTENTEGAETRRKKRGL